MDRPGALPILRQGSGQALRQGSGQVYSPSRISTYESCPRQYKYRYIDRIPREEESIEAFLGSRVHEALNKLYRDLQLGKPPSLPDLLAYYEWDWGRRWHDQVRIVKQDFSIEHYKGIGGRCLVNYYQAHKPFDRGQTLGLEHKVTSSLDQAGRYRIQGYVDRLVRVRPGHYEVHDYKTSGRLPAQDQIDADRQLALYQLGVAGMCPDAEEIELVWHYLAFGKELRSRRTPEALERLKKTTIALIDRIEADTEFTPIKSLLCQWCAYLSICPIWTDRTAETPALRVNILGGVGSVRVSDQDDEIRLDLRSCLREALLAAAEAQAGEIRESEDGQLWVHLDEPTEPDAPNGAADGWILLSDESLSLLLRQVERGRWSAEFVEKLERYLAS
jgi:putative RecB family exonuclease